MENEAEPPVDAVRTATPPDAARLARLRYEFRAAEDPAVESREAFLDRCEPWTRERRGLGSALLERAVETCREEDIDSLILWPTDRSRSLYRRFGCAPSEGIFERDLRRPE